METLTTKVSFYKKKDIAYRSMEVDKGNGYLAPVVESPFSNSLGAGFMKLEEAGSYEWQVQYDEVIIVVSGELYIKEDEIVKYGKLGDVFFLKDGAKIVYGTESKAEFFYSLYPANWREIKNN